MQSQGIPVKEEWGKTQHSTAQHQDSLLLLWAGHVPSFTRALIAACRTGAGGVRTCLIQNPNKLLLLACKHYITEVRDWQYYN